MENDKLNQIKKFLPKSVLKTQPKSYKDALLLKADTDASGHYIASKDMNKAGIVNLKESTQPKLVQLPNEEVIKSSHESNLNIPNISSDASKATVFLGITSSSLLSIGKLCDDECTVIFTKKEMKVVKDDNVILEGKRNHVDG